MKKIFILCFNFFLFWHEHSFNSFDAIRDFVWKRFKNKEKNQNDIREFATTGKDSHTIRFVHDKSDLERQKWTADKK